MTCSSLGNLGDLGLLPARVFIGGLSPAEETEETLGEAWISSGCSTSPKGVSKANNEELGAVGRQEWFINEGSPQLGGVY